ncbi:MAG: glutamine synthetase [Gammaproteobacteria bacterium]|nr:glutamine synthetase [Gammaproteobacteria bacterium]
MRNSVSEFFSAHAETRFLDLIIPDINGIARGKRVRISPKSSVFTDGIMLPRSLFASDICGRTVLETGLGIATGDQDLACRPDISTLRPVPWIDKSTAQCFMEMYDGEGNPFHSSPRHILRQVVAAMHRRGLHPVVAVEMEFFLLRKHLDRKGQPQLLLDPVSGREERSTQVYSMDDLDNVEPFIESVQRYAAAQAVPASAVIAEYAPGQFEINLEHKDDPVAACDDALCLKRIIRRAARDHGLLATFMAKPFADISGSGTHIHLSLYDKNGNNRFAAKPDDLKHAIAGLQATMADAMLLFAPHENSYRRFRKNCYVPLSPSWGFNNRSVALRVPAGPDSARRIEHRLAGADTNPYLAMAAIIAGILHGLEECLEADAPIDGDASEQCDPTLPVDWLQSIRNFSDSLWIEKYLGADFQSLVATIKHAEHSAYQQHVSALDIQWYLRTV